MGTGTEEQGEMTAMGPARAAQKDGLTRGEAWAVSDMGGPTPGPIWPPGRENPQTLWLGLGALPPFPTLARR